MWVSCRALTAGTSPSWDEPGTDHPEAVGTCRNYVSRAQDPELVVTAALEETADFAALRQRIETRALTHARIAVGNPSLPTQLDLTVTTKRSTRVA
jgi:hypothetical protein